MSKTQQLLQKAFGNRLFDLHWITEASECSGISRQTLRNWRDMGIEATMDKLDILLSAYNKRLEVDNDE